MLRAQRDLLLPLKTRDAKWCQLLQESLEERWFVLSHCGAGGVQGHV